MLGSMPTPDDYRGWFYRVVAPHSVGYEAGLRERAIRALLGALPHASAESRPENSAAAGGQQ
jgi:hypothetical protein